MRLELVDERFYHLDTCCCPLGGDGALYYQPAFSSESRAQLESAFERLVAVPEEEALRFACNALVVDGAGCPRTGAALRAQGLRSVERPPMSSSRPTAA